MTSYTIQAKGHTYRFPTIEAAKAVAAEIFAKTGVIVGIQEA